jgi:translocation and assembly module TamB
MHTTLTPQGFSGVWYNWNFKNLPGVFRDLYVFIRLILFGSTLTIGCSARYFREDYFLARFFKALLILVILLSLAVGGFLILASKGDLGAGAVVSKLGKAARQHLGAELALSSVSGNPIKGFRISDLVLRREGSMLLSAPEVTVVFKPLSLLSGSPRIRFISFGGALLNWSDLAPMISGEGAVKPMELPFDTLLIQKSIVRTPRGDLKIEEGKAALDEGAIDASASLLYRETPLLLKARLEPAGEELHLRELLLKTAQGTLAASGRVLPGMDLTGEISGLDIRILERFRPDLAKRGCSGNLSATFSARGDWPKVTAEGVLDIPRGEIYGIDMEDASSSWRFSDNILELKHVKGRANGAALSGTLRFSLGAAPPVTAIDITARGAEVDLWKKTFPWLYPLADGTIDSLDVTLRGPSNSLSGTVTLGASALTLLGQPLSDIGGSLENKEGSTIALDLGAKWLGSPLKGEGSVAIGSRPMADIILSGENLDLSRAQEALPALNLPLSGRAAGKIRLFGAVSELGAEGTLLSERITASGETLEKPRIAFAYSGGTMNLNSASALWRGTAVTGSGQITDLEKGRGTFDLKGAAAEGPVSNLAAFVPALKELGLEGVASAAWNLKGPLETPTLALEIRSSRVTVPERATLAGMKILTKVSLPLSGDTPDMRLDMAAESLELPSGTLSNLRTAFTVSSGVMNIENARGEILGACLSLTGSARLPSPNRAGGVDLKGTATGVDLSMLGDRIPFEIHGPLETDFAIKGDLPIPEITLSGRSPSIVLAGLNLSDLTFNARGDASRMTLEDLKGFAGRGALTVTGTADILPGGVDLDFSLEGSGLDLALVTKEIQGNGRPPLAGTADVALSGSLEKGAWKVRGTIFSETLAAYGIDFDDVTLPVTLEEGSMRVENATGRFCEGRLSGGGDVETATGRWNIRAAVRGADMEQAVRALTHLEGRITGKGDLDLNLSGAFGKHLLVTGGGNLTAAEGEVSDFKALKAISSAYGMSSLRYRMLDANFKIDGNVVTLLPGSRAAAHGDDALYRYLTVDGAAGPGGNLNLYCSGLVNVQALNTLLGAIQGLAVAGSASPEAILEGLIGGVVGGMGKQDFRESSFRVEGTWSNPLFTCFRVAPPQGASRPMAESDGVGQTRQDDREHKVTISIPTGESAGE